jgi:hypothetical protein
MFADKVDSARCEIAMDLLFMVTIQVDESIF